VEDDATLPGPGAATLPDSTAAPGPDALPTFEAQRYHLGSLLGRGGMGEIRLARDTRIDREVAVKLMRGDLDPGLIARFFREARVQGALEHPAIVPVHDLGIYDDGVPYFVMKRLAGTTLGEVLGTRNPELGARWPRRLLLGRFVDICLAIEFAHARGVVHRDLKPANLMLGDFGEAYVLDWGLARIIGDPESSPRLPVRTPEEGHTEAGQMLGTPGYMSPEQTRGEPVDAGADVFGLGCVLYEILAGVPALPRGLPAIAATLEAAEHRPSLRAEVAPELDELCARATAARAADRPTARELAEAIQAYLDGDRDIERRRELGMIHAERAASALGVTGSSCGDDARATAMREAGRALVLDPENAIAKDVLTTLMLSAPAAMPAPALAAAAAERARSRQDVTRFGARAYLGLAVVTSVLFLLPLHHVWPVVLAVTLAAGTALAMQLVSRPAAHVRFAEFLLILILSCTLLAMPGLIFGPLLVLPMVVIGSLAAWLSQTSEVRPWVVIAVHLLPVGVVLALELLGITPPTFRIEHDSLVLTSWVLDLTPATTIIVLAISGVTQIVNTSVTALTTRHAAEQAQNAVHAQRWHLQQVLPQVGTALAAPVAQPVARSCERSPRSRSGLPPAPPSPPGSAA
jgi:serine/threonine-protein kinase